MADINADSKFGTLLGQLEAHYFDFDERGSSTGKQFRILLNELKDTHEQQVARWRDLAETLEVENNNLRQANSCFLRSSLKSNEVLDLVLLLRRGLDDGAEFEEISSLLERIEKDMAIDELDEKCSRDDAQGRGLIHLCVSCPLRSPSDMQTCVKLLGEKRCDPARPSKGGESALSRVCRLSDEPVPVLQELLRLRASPNVAHEHGESPLLISVRKRNITAAKVLLDWGADPSAADALDETPLMDAASEGDEGMCRLLLERRADPTAKNQFELSAIDYAEDAALLQLFDGRLLPVEVMGDSPPTQRTTGKGRAASSTAMGAGDGSDQRSVNPRLGEMQQRWIVTEQDIRTARKGTSIPDSEVMRVPGIPVPFRVRYFPRGSLEDAKGTCSFSIIPEQDKKAKQVTVPITLFSPTWGETAVSIASLDWRVNSDSNFPYFRINATKTEGRAEFRFRCRSDSKSQHNHLEILYNPDILSLSS